MFDSIIENGTIKPITFFIIVLVSLASGFVFALLSCFRSKSSKSFKIATSLLPMAVATVILLVNGNLGVGIAIAGAFGLVRFRSAPGTAKEIAVIFIAMASGLAFGTGFLAYGIIILIISGIVLLIFDIYESSKKNSQFNEKYIKITIPESLDYTNVFDDIFTEFTKEYSLEKVKSTNMGSMFRLTYKVILRNCSDEKKLIDAIRTRNGNLEVICSRSDIVDVEL